MSVPSVVRCFKKEAIYDRFHTLAVAPSMGYGSAQSFGRLVAPSFQGAVH